MKLKALTTIRRICGLLGVVVCDGIMFIMSININTIYSFSFLTLWMKGTSIFQEFPPALLRCSTSKWHNDNSKRQSKKTSSVAYTIDHNDTKMNVNNATESKSPSFFSSCNSMLALDTEKQLGKQSWVNNVHAMNSARRMSWFGQIHLPNGKHHHMVGWKAVCRLCMTSRFNSVSSSKEGTQAIQTLWIGNSCGTNSSRTRNIQNIETLLAQASVSHCTLNRTVAQVLLPLVTKIQIRKR